MAALHHGKAPPGFGRSFRLTLLVGIHLCFGLLVFLAIHFAEERLFMDASYYLFQVINQETFHVELQRFVLVCGQWLPWLGVKLHLPMAAIIILASLGYVLFYYVLFLVCWLRYKRPEAGFALILIQLLGVVHGFFTPVFELYLSAGLLIVYDTIFQVETKSWKKDTVLVILQVVILLSHPMALLLWALVIWRHLSGARPFPWRLVLALLGLSVVVYLFKAPFTESYERDKLEYLLGQMGSLEAYRPLLDAGYWIKLATYLITWYWEAVALFAISVVVLWRRIGYKIPLAGIGVFTIVLLVNQVGYDGLQPGRYMEQVYFPMVAVVILLSLWTWKMLSDRGRWGFLIVILMLIGSRIVCVVDAGEHFQYRNAQLHRLIDHAQGMGGGKWLTSTRNLGRSYNWGNWSIPVEALLLSAMDGSDKAINMVFEESWKELQIKPPKDEFIFRLDEVYAVSELNAQYFNLESEPYKWLQDPNAELPVLEDLRTILTINTEPAKKYKENVLVQIPVKIAYRGAGTLPVHANNHLSLSYHWYKANGEEYIWDGIRTPIEVDVNYRYKQPIEVRTPAQPGDYVLEVDWVLEGVGWGETGKRHSIQIR